MEVKLFLFLILKCGMLLYQLKCLNLLSKDISIQLHPLLPTISHISNVYSVWCVEFKCGVLVTLYSSRIAENSALQYTVLSVTLSIVLDSISFLFLVKKHITQTHFTLRREQMFNACSCAANFVSQTSSCNNLVKLTVTNLIDLLECDSPSHLSRFASTLQTLWPDSFLDRYVR